MCYQCDFSLWETFPNYLWTCLCVTIVSPPTEFLSIVLTVDVNLIALLLHRLLLSVLPWLGIASSLSYRPVLKE